MPERDKIKSVFSFKKKSMIGTGGTKRKVFQKTFWLVEEKENGEFEIQALSENDIPSGPRQTITRSVFLDNYNPEPELYAQKVLPRMQMVLEKVRAGEEHRKNAETYSAEYEFNSALELDEENVRANFGLGLTYLDRGEVERADDIFRRLIKIDAIYETRHKHLFNAFGISLRKNKMIDQALEYYQKAEKIHSNDENLYLNIARAYFEKGNFKECISSLDKSLDLNPGLEEAGVFWSYMQDNGYAGGDDLVDEIDVTVEDEKLFPGKGREG